jgi:aspartyl-tRNA(Asn)/glutamyl-tRNA(Gln) amidotransferase subunit B
VNTTTKLFSPAPAPGSALVGDAGMPQKATSKKAISRKTASKPNIDLDLFDIAVPGTLPVLNQAVVEKSVKAAIALKCRINNNSYFDRKHYFYQDLPLGYQITQQNVPIAEDGTLHFRYVDESGSQCEGAVGIKRIQIEQDSAKSIHDLDDEFTLIDFGRAGNPLIEMVFAPTIRTPRQASSVLQRIQQVLRHIDVCNGDMEDGSLRCDVNISVFKVDDSNTAGQSQRLGTSKVEVKNLSSPHRVEAAAAYEIERQIDLLHAGETIYQETRGFDSVKETTYLMRVKNSEVEYRFFPDPDLPPLEISEEEVAAFKAQLPEMPEDTMARLQRDVGISSYQFGVLMTLQVLKYFESVMQLLPEGADRHRVASSVFNAITTDIQGLANYVGVDVERYLPSSRHLLDAVLLIDRKEITPQRGKELFRYIYENRSNKANYTIAEIIDQLGWTKVTDTSLITELCEASVNDAKNAKEVQKYKSGKTNMINFFLGDVMKACRNNNAQPDPAVVRGILEELLKGKS